MFSRINIGGDGDNGNNKMILGTGTGADSINKWLLVQTRNQPPSQQQQYHHGNLNNNHYNHPTAIHPQHRERAISNSSTIGMSVCSSFDVMSDTGSMLSFLSDATTITNSPSPPKQNVLPPNPFIAHFEELNRLPLCHWLKKNGGGAGGGNGNQQQQNGIPKNAAAATMNKPAMQQQQQATTIIPDLSKLLAQVKTLRSGMEELEEKLEEMSLMGGEANKPANGANANMIVAKEEKMDAEEEESIANGDSEKANSFWMPSFTRTPMMTTTTILPNAYDEQPPPLLKLPSDPAHWLKKYPPPLKPKRPMNEMAEDLSCWESVLGWKSILEKIHASGEHVWLAPSSRALKG